MNEPGVHAPNGSRVLACAMVPCRHGPDRTLLALRGGRFSPNKSNVTTDMRFS